MSLVKRSEADRRVLPVESGQGRRIKPGEPGDFVEELARRKRQSDQGAARHWEPTPAEAEAEPEPESLPEDRVEISGLNLSAEGTAKRGDAAGREEAAPVMGRHLDVKG